MMFCPECKSMLKSYEGKLRCPKCGYEKDISDKTQLLKTRQRVEKEITIVEEDQNIATLPTTKIKCPECGNNTAEWWLRQLRSADESEVRFFRCTKCRHTWREYD
ncbi:transcription factor S [Methanomicrobium antiquum]|uniref:Transcription factor S n=1 Tax=Methanomicrobium antiquum TaxID=487686 RepID=A0AAF0FM06_9EURY|nr:transcription factor S [Methanomicrobium antiquum]MDD3976581.1 transcription factor S [Methanomicrobium sp.]WFN36052.1 transcription factor S [Methanomicrobium antiquum]